MKNAADLKRDAERTAKDKGHNLGPWLRDGWGGTMEWAECRKCHGQARIYPDDTDITIGGTVIFQTCAKAKEYANQHRRSEKQEAMTL